MIIFIRTKVNIPHVPLHAGGMPNTLLANYADEAVTTSSNLAFHKIIHREAPKI